MGNGNSVALASCLLQMSYVESARFGAEATHVGVKPVNSLTAGLGAGMFVPHSGCNWRADCLGLHGTARAATLPQRAFDRAQDYDAFGSGRVTCRQPGARSTPSE